MDMPSNYRIIETSQGFDVQIKRMILGLPFWFYVWRGLSYGGAELFIDNAETLAKAKLFKKSDFTLDDESVIWSNRATVCQQRKGDRS